MPPVAAAQADFGLKCLSRVTLEYGRDAPFMRAFYEHVQKVRHGVGRCTAGAGAVRGTHASVCAHVRSWGGVTTGTGHAGGTQLLAGPCLEDQSLRSVCIAEEAAAIPFLAALGAPPSYVQAIWPTPTLHLYQHVSLPHGLRGMWCCG